MEKDETTPDELLGSFKGRSLKSIIVFTVAVHAVILIGTSIPSLLGGMVKEDLSDMTEDERISAAVGKAKDALKVIDEERDRKANATLAEIAENYGLEPQALGDQLEAPQVKETATPEPEPEASDPVDSETPGDTEPKSAIEQEIEKVEKGPAVPPVEEEEEDLFK